MRKQFLWFLSRWAWSRLNKPVIDNVYVSESVTEPFKSWKTITCPHEQVYESHSVRRDFPFHRKEKWSCRQGVFFSGPEQTRRVCFKYLQCIVWHGVFVRTKTAIIFEVLSRRALSDGKPIWYDTCLHNLYIFVMLIDRLGRFYS